MGAPVKKQGTAPTASQPGDRLTPAQQRIIDACSKPVGTPIVAGASREDILKWVRGA
jgi:hypothetical protein